jgi:hypothetical protein
MRAGDTITGIASAARTRRSNFMITKAAALVLAQKIITALDPHPTQLCIELTATAIYLAVLNDELVQIRRDNALKVIERGKS